MFEFLRIQYRLGNVTEAKLKNYVKLKRITQEEYEQIISGE